MRAVKIGSLCLASLMLTSVGCSSEPDDSATDSPDGATETAAPETATQAPGTATQAPGTATQVTGSTPTETGNTPGSEITPTPDSGTEPFETGTETSTPTEVPDYPEPAVCDTVLPPAENGICDITAGTDGVLLLRGNIMLPNGIVQAGEMLVVDDTIMCVDCSCSEEDMAAEATVISCPDGFITPGLINAHDHITYTEAVPEPHGDERYDHRNEWRRGICGATSLPSDQNSDGLGDGWGEMRQVITGSTSLFGSGGEAGFMRNLDRDDKLEGLTGPDAYYDTFPLGDGGFSYLVEDGCSDYDIDSVDFESTTAYAPHMSEGINDTARNEFLCAANLQEDGGDLLTDKTAFIHSIGLKTSDIALMADRDAAIIWSPRSNTDLYGMTAEAPTYQKLNIPIALGSDWTASGSVNLVRELACAEEWSDTYWNGHFTDAQLISMATQNAADVLGFGEQIGRLYPGMTADIAIWNGATNQDYRAILDSDPEDVALVLRGGVALFGESHLLAELTTEGECDTMDVCGETRSICTQRELGLSQSEMEARMELAISYDLLFCEAPEDEPSCLPARPGEYDGIPTENDSDGDNFANDVDNCPDHFNPLRPVDGDVQADVDGDGLGDICDPCPFDADTTSCSLYTENDTDADGIENAADNCPNNSNEDQGDADTDGIGDACDACPEFSNANGAECPLDIITIYDIKMADSLPCDTVLIEGAIVTATTGNAFWMTTDPSSDAYTGPDFASIYVYAGGADSMPVEGDIVTVEGNASVYFGQTQFVAYDVAVTGSSDIPAAVEVSAADLCVGGDKELELEASLVVVYNVAVTDIDPAGAEGENVSNEYLVDECLSVDGYLHVTDPFPALGQEMDAIVGVTRLNWDRNKLSPRSADDTDFGPAYLVTFTPDEAYIYEGSEGISSPSLVAQLSIPAEDDTFIAITSDDEAVVTVVNGGVTILAGERSAEVALTGVSDGGPIVLTADPDGEALTTTVIVLDEAFLASPVSISPEVGDVVVNGTIELTVYMDAPAPPGGQDVSLEFTGDLMVPDSLTVNGGEWSGSVLVDASGTGQGTVTAFVGDVSVTATINITEQEPLGLILAEIYYDHPDDDNGKEWVKLYNGSSATVDLSAYSLGYGGQTYTNATYQLSGTIEPYSCYIVGGPTATAENGDPTFDLETPFSSNIQNSGSNADAMGLFMLGADDILEDSVPMDAVLYGGENAHDFIGSDGEIIAEPDVEDVISGYSILRTSGDTWEPNETPNAIPCYLGAN